MEANLKVNQAYPSDSGRGVARLDPEAMLNLKISPGNIIKIVGKRETVAKVWRAPKRDWGKGILRIDRFVRENTGSGIGDGVKVERVEPESGRTVTIAPLKKMDFKVYGMDIGEYLKHQLLKRPLIEGDIIPVIGSPALSGFGKHGQGHAQLFVAVKTDPKGPVFIDESTRIIYRDEPAKGFERMGKAGITYEDIGGLKEELQKIREIVELPLKYPEIFQRLGIDPPKGVMLTGPPGTGKTLITKAVANEIGASFFTINGPEIMSKFYGESEQRLRDIFEEARENSPSIILIDEIDALAPKRDDVTGEVERRVVAQLLALMDGLEERGQVVVIGATNRIDAVDPALRRPGRYDRELEIGVPDLDGRKEVLQVHTRNMPLEPEYGREEVLESLERVKNNLTKETEGSEAEKEPSESMDSVIEKVKNAEDGDVTGIVHLLPSSAFAELKRQNIKNMLRTISEQTHGFVGADIESLCKEAAMKALRRYLPQIDLENEEVPTEVLDSIRVTMDDFKESLKEIEPSALREVVVEVPMVSWENVGGLDDVKREVVETVEWPLRYPEKFKKFDIRPPRGVLLYGPPGTGKTLIAKAVANETNANFITVKGSELLSKWLGESEKAVREIFKKAKQVSPCIVFFDELDATAQTRGTGESSRAVERVVNQLLIEIDGLEELEDVMIVGATNRPDILDKALLRPGRFDRLVFVRAPGRTSRKAIINVHLKGMPVAEDVDLEELADITEGYVGADIEAVAREAVMLAFREDIDTEEIEMRHFMDSLKKVRPSVDESIINFYGSFEERMKSESTKATSTFMGYG
ncbi:MAG: CDC48 family AAA ATPase [Archaeoglobaceae archaeon]